MVQGLVEWLQAEAPERQVYAYPPLTLALCQVRFASKFGLNDFGVAAFQEGLEVDYPNPERQQQIAAIQVGQQSAQMDIQASLPETLWKFTDVSGDWTVTLTESFVTLETRLYADFDDFLGRLVQVLEVLNHSIRPRTGRRIGLRYINEIRSTDGDWSKVIQRDLLGVLSLPSFQKSTQRALQVLTMQAEEESINLQHGIFQSGTTVVPKHGAQAPSEPFYLLDIDMYHEFMPPAELQMDPATIAKHVEEYHTTVSRLFRWATTEEYRESLGRRDDVG